MAGSGIGRQKISCPMRTSREWGVAHPRVGSFRQRAVLPPFRPRVLPFLVTRHSSLVTALLPFLATRHEALGTALSGS